MFARLRDFIKPQTSTQKHIDFQRHLIRQEAQIGGQVFGPVGPNRRREFFCLDEHTWIWHEEWLDQTGIHQSRTTRYDVRPDGILKAQNGGTYRRVDATEAQNLYAAAELYVHRVKNELHYAR